VGVNFLKKIGKAKVDLKNFALLAAGTLLIALVYPTALFADINVEVQVNPQKGTVTDIFLYEVTLSGAEAGQLGEPSFDESEYFTIERVGVQQQFQFLFGSQSASIILSYKVYPNPGLKPGKYPLPRALFSVGNKEIVLKPKTVEIVKAETVQKGTVSTGVNFSQFVDNTNPYVGEQIVYRVDIVTTKPLYNLDLQEVTLPNFWRESFGRATEQIRSVQNNTAKIITVREGLFPSKSGNILHQARVLSAKVPVERKTRRRGSAWTSPLTSLDSIFSFGGRNTVQKRFVAEAIPINIRALPAPPKKKP